MPVAQADEAEARAESIVQKYGAKRSSLIHVLQDLQEEFDYLPRAALECTSERLGVPISEVLRVATFYAAFSLEPRGEHMVTVCMGTACHVRGAERILLRLQDVLGIEAGGTTDDLQFSLETVNCLGACALGPLISVDGKYYGKMTPNRVPEVLEEHGFERDSDED
ncbi:MAG: NAD(P)H-dependent oxidoreductase subunit E [Candidatus Brocadiia bacterium]